MIARRVLVTGAAGFIGRHLCEALVRDGEHVVAAIRSGDDRRRLPKQVREALVFFESGNIGETTNWSAGLVNCDVVVHLAGRAHVINDEARDPLAEFRAVNVQGTLNLARQAALHGVKRFVFISSIGVNGDASSGPPFDESTVPSPQSGYAISKHETELALWEFAAGTEMEIVVLRPPLVYGPGAPGNFEKLVKLVRRVRLLPFGSIRNSRSFIFIGNLVDAITVCTRHPAAAGQTFLVSDGEDVSTPELVKRLAQTMGRPVHIVAFPVLLLKTVGWLTGNSGAVRRLVDSLVIDSSKIRRDLGWTPPCTLTEGIESSVKSWSATEPVSR
jgi:nucleoside-diphosphate-sugar epimerase